MFTYEGLYTDLMTANGEGGGGWVSCVGAGLGGETVVTAPSVAGKKYTTILNDV